MGSAIHTDNMVKIVSSKSWMFLPLMTTIRYLLCESTRQCTVSHAEQKQNLKEALNYRLKTEGSNSTKTEIPENSVTDVTR